MKRVWVFAVCLGAGLVAWGGERRGPSEGNPVGGEGAPDGRAGGSLAGALGAGEAEGESEEDEADSPGRGPAESDEAWEGEEPGSELASAPDGGRRRKRGGCPASMVRVGEFCVDRFEAPNRRGERPLVMQTASDAEAWCSERHKRLCTEEEWVGACAGPERRTYPYGNGHADGRCNDDQTARQVDEAKLAKWPAPEAKAYVKELYRATPGGAKRQCVTEDGVYDLTGNVEEWVDRSRAGSGGGHVLMGCAWAGCRGGGKPTCTSASGGHRPEYRFYTTGFRCCRDLASKLVEAGHAVRREDPSE